MTLSPSDLPEPPEGFNCGTCFFWLLQPDLRLAHLGDARLGQCRCHAPRVLNKGTGVITRWPLTAEHDWCGEHAVADTASGVREEPLT